MLYPKYEAMVPMGPMLSIFLFICLVIIVGFIVYTVYLFSLVVKERDEEAVRRYNEELKNQSIPPEELE